MKLSHYEWDPEKDLIAEGGFAEVFKAKDTNTSNRWVALKIYKEAVSRGTTGSTGQKKYSLEQEFDKIDGLSHTNIITFYGLEYIEHIDAMGRTASYPVLIMEYAGEGTLKDISSKQLTAENLDEIIASVIKATGYLHSQGVIHRDLKPGNVLFSKDRNGKLVAKITDFGISKDVLGDKTIEQSFTEGVGTPHYMAPEQFFKKKFGLNGEVSERTDIWAIGIILYRLLTGKLPFGHGLKDYELIRDEITQKEVDLSGIPEQYKKIIAACLTKEANKRPSSADELLTLLDSNEVVHKTRINTPLIQHIDDEATVFPSSENHSGAIKNEKPKQKNSVLKYAIIGLIIAGLGFGGFKWYQHSKATALLTTAWNFYKDGNFKEAYATFNDATDYNSGRAYYYLSVMNAQGRGIDRDYKKSEEFANKAIDHGYDMAGFPLGDLYKYGWGVPIDTVKATKYYDQSLIQIKKLVKDNDVEAMHLYGLLYSDTTLGILDSVKSFELVKKAADKDHPIAKSNLAIWYQNGFGVEKNCDEALKLLKEGLAINFDRSINALGKLYFNGCGDITQNYEKALQYYKIAAKQNNLLSQNSIGYMYHFGKGVPVDLDEALVWYTRAADGDHIAAFNNLGLIYKEKKNFKKAREWYLKAAKKNDKYGAYNLGNLFNTDEYANKNIDSSNYWYRKAIKFGHIGGAQVQLGYNFFIGRGLEKNVDSAFYWYDKAALQNYNVGQYYLGTMYQTGEGCEQDYAKAKELYEKASAQGNISANHAIGGLFYNGDGVEKNYYTARKWYQKSADKELTSSQYMLGYMNENKQGGAQNYYEARKWYQKSAEKEHADSQQRLGTLYLQGKGGSVNMKLGFTWIEKAAKAGNNEGERKLGLCYFYGYGVPKSKSQARIWLNKSCKQGNSQACTQIKELL
tara:strand:- start:422914 stop:425649 length:2736 start_codon:yes stop_codon:yes gene_type:complete